MNPKIDTLEINIFFHLKTYFIDKKKFIDLGLEKEAFNPEKAFVINGNNYEVAYATRENSYPYEIQGYVLRKCLKQSQNKNYFDITNLIVGNKEKNLFSFLNN